MFSLVQDLIINFIRKEKGHEDKARIIKSKMEILLRKLNEDGIGFRIKFNGNVYLLSIKSPTTTTKTTTRTTTTTTTTSTRSKRISKRRNNIF